jgi:NAD(P)-dependent dehydrogenase (short-subunit alcohol dehydrogenase family)
MELIRAGGGSAHALFGDISVPDDCARLVEEAHAAMGTIDVLVNNVGNSQHDADPLNLISKAGVNAITGFFAVQYAQYKNRCNAILPSWILTPHSFEGLVRAGVASSEEEIIGFGRQRVPLGFMGVAEDIGNAALFVASEESRFVTGQELPVDGGTLAIVGQYSGPTDPELQVKQGSNV